MADGSNLWRRADEDDGGGLPHVRATEIDMMGERVGAWTVVARVASRGKQGARWLCKCACGTVREITTARLRGTPALRWCRACQIAAQKAARVTTTVHRPSRRRTGTRGETIAISRWSVRELRAGVAEYPVAETASYDRPRVRLDCLPGGCNEARPCPWVSCRHHLALGVDEHNGNIKLNFPDVDIECMNETCALDVADRGGETLDGVGERLNLTRERVRQLELEAFVVLRDSRRVRSLAGVAERGEDSEPDDGSGARTPAEAVEGLYALGFGGECGVPV